MASLTPKFLNQQPEPNRQQVTSLGDVLSAANVAARPLPILMSKNMGSTTFTMSLPVRTFMERSEVLGPFPFTVVPVMARPKVGWCGGEVTTAVIAVFRW